MRVEETPMSPTNFARCTACHKGELTPAHLTVTLTNDGRSFSVDDNDALVCSACGEEFIGERAAAFELTHRALAWYAEMAATVARRTEIV
jgi:YgiT-type zinc finger domain-containing protein